MTPNANWDAQSTRKKKTAINKLNSIIQILLYAGSISKEWSF